MIVTTREMAVTTKDVVPQPGDRVVRANEHETEVLRAVAHWPMFNVSPRPGSVSGGLWEVSVMGERKPEIVISVVYHGQMTGRRTGVIWREVSGR